MTSSRVARRNMQDDPPFSAVRNIDDSGNRLDAQRFTAMRLSGDAQTIGDQCHGRACYTAEGAWKRRW